MSSAAANSTMRRERAASATATKRAAKQSSAKHSAPPIPAVGNAAGAIASVKDTVLSSRALTIAVIVIAALLLGFMLDTALNWGKAYGNVSVGGVDVGGLDASDMRKKLEDTYGTKLKSSEVTVYASEKARDKGQSDLEKEERKAQAEQVSVEDAASSATSWTASGAELSATLPYDEIIDKAIGAGRSGGPFGRLAVVIAGEDVPVSVVFDENALDNFAGTVDKAVGDARIDTTVEISDGTARPVEGHDGNIVDRDWLAGKLGEAMLSDDETASVVAETVEAPSRTTLEQAQRVSDGLNKALGAGATFSYKSAGWTADAAELGKWTKVELVETGEGYDLQPNLDPSTATASLVKNVSITPTKQSSDNVSVTFEKGEDGIVVHCTGSAEVPDVVDAVSELDEKLYGAEGIAWSADSSPKSPTIEIGESNTPESLTFEQAVELGIITVIGEYTTEFSNEEGTENRNHNIKLVCDLLDDSICTAHGGKWSFNEHTGDTNMDPPFASAGSIVNGEYVDSIGGGICQVATTVFNAVYEAGLDVTERRNHSLFIGSYPTGRDVGVSYPELDFVWADNLDSDVLMKTSYTDTTVTVKLYSVYTGYTVESVEGEWENGEKYVTTYEVDDSLAKGDYYIKTTGENGSRITVTRTVKDKDGKIVSETEFESVYEPKNEVYLVGPGTDTSALGEDQSEDDEEKSSDDEGDSGESEGSSDEADSDDYESGDEE